MELPDRPLLSLSLATKIDQATRDPVPQLRYLPVFGIRGTILSQCSVSCYLYEGPSYEGNFQLRYFNGPLLPLRGTCHSFVILTVPCYLYEGVHRKLFSLSSLPCVAQEERKNSLTHE